LKIYYICFLDSREKDTDLTGRCPRKKPAAYKTRKIVILSPERAIISKTPSEGIATLTVQVLLLFSL
jgi:hypothetical protein